MAKDTGNQTAKITYLLLRKSPFFVATPILAIEILYQAAAWLLVIGGLAISEAGIQAPPLLITLIILLTVVKIFFLVGVILIWSNDFYEVRPGEIMHHRGVITRRRKAISIGEVRSLTLKQDVLGIIFRFGTINLYNPAAQDTITLSGISNPRRAQEMLSQFLPNIKEPPSGYIGSNS